MIRSYQIGIVIPYQKLDQTFLKRSKNESYHIGINLINLTLPRPLYIGACKYGKVINIGNNTFLIINKNLFKRYFNPQCEINSQFYQY